MTRLRKVTGVPAFLLLALVPEHPRDEPQVLAIEPEHYQAAAAAFVALGHALANIDPGTRPER